MDAVDDIDIDDGGVDAQQPQPQIDSLNPHEESQQTLDAAIATPAGTKQRLPPLPLSSAQSRLPSASLASESSPLRPVGASDAPIEAAETTEAQGTQSAYTQPHAPRVDATTDIMAIANSISVTPYVVEQAEAIMTKYAEIGNARDLSRRSSPDGSKRPLSALSAHRNNAPGSGGKRLHWASANAEDGDFLRFDDPNSAPAGEYGKLEENDVLPPIVRAKTRDGELPIRESLKIAGVDLELDEEDAEGDDAIMDPDNPLMKRVQEALLKQLSEQDAKLLMEIKDKEEAVRKAIKKREEIGVELYQSQQQLARLQALLEGTHDNLAVIKGYREEAERTLKHTSFQHKDELEKKSQHALNLEKHKQELEKISRTLKQVDLYNDELKSKILVAKRTTLKAEEDIIKQETEKKRQDYFIDHLADQLRRLQERRALYESQLVAQQRETKAAVETLQEAGTEMEAIQYEKRQLLHQWKSSLIGLQRRDEVLENVEKGIQKNKDILINLQGEINGFRQSLRRAQEQSETLTLLMAKLEAEVDHLKRQIGTVAEQRDRLNDNYSMYSKTLQATEADLAQVMQERQALQLEVSAVMKMTQQTATACARLESEIAEHLQNQLAIEKGAQGAKKDNNRLRASIHEKEATIAATNNEVANIKIEMSNASARITSLKEILDGVDKDLTEKNNLVEQYEMEIRRRNDELGKKQGEMDLLNKKYDQLMARNQDESMGPLEATIHNVTKLVSQKEQDCTQLQQFWLRSQNELVAVTKRSNELAEETADLKMRLAVLSRKKAVINNQFETESKEIREHQRNIRALQNDMVKINTLLSKQSQVQSVLEENNLGLEQEFRARLKSAELDSVRMEARIDELRSEKERALQGLVEAERQIMLWEKKIQLARETQAALDPNVGATEIKEMAIEIHRMKLRYASMLKLQERMIAEMEKSVYRRESIATRTKTKGKGGGQAVLQKEIAELTKKIKQTMNDVKDCDGDVQSLQSSQENFLKQIEESKSACITLSTREDRLLQELSLTMQKKNMLMSETLLHQRQARRYNELKDGKYTYLIKDPAVRQVEFDRQQERLKKIDDVLQVVMGEFSVARDMVEPLHEFLEGLALIL